MRRECRERFPPPPISKETASWGSRHASRHVRDARAVMHVGIAHLRWRGKRSRHSRRMRTRNFTYLARGPWEKTSKSALKDFCDGWGIHHWRPVDCLHKGPKTKNWFYAMRSYTGNLGTTSTENEKVLIMCQTCVRNIYIAIVADWIKSKQILSQI